MNFIHIPKNAGTSIKAALTASNLELPSLPNHFTLSQIINNIAIVKNNSEFFSCVRDPYDRAHSIYWFLKKAHSQFPQSLAGQGLDINEFWVELYKLKGFYMHYQSEETFKKFIPKCPMFKSQMDFLRDKEGEGGVSSRIKTILRFESLEDDWKAFAIANDLADLNHINKTEKPETSYADEFRDDVIAMIGEMYADDFEHLGYKRLM
jgi:hypothetical protein